MRAEIGWVLWELAQRESTWPHTLPWLRAYELHLDQVLAEIDPIVRKRVTAAVKRHISKTLRFCSEHDRSRFTARVAYLEFNNSHTDFDPAHIARALEEIGPAQKPGRLRYVTTTVALAITFLVGCALAVLIPDWWLDWELEEPSARAYQEGGRPLAGDGAERFWFEESFAQFVVAMDRARGAEQPIPTERHDAFIEQFFSDVEDTLLAPCEGQLTAYLHILLKIHSQDNQTPETLRVAEQAANRCLQTAGMAYQVETHVQVLRGATRVLAGTFEVERVDFYESEGQRVQTLFWRRVDHLTWRRSVLGYTSPDLDNARVLTEKIDSFVTEDLIPALHPEGTLKLFDLETRGVESWARELETAAGSAVRKEMHALTGAREACAELGTLIAQRQALFKRWNQQLRSRGARVLPAEHYAVDLDRYDRLDGILLPGEVTTFQSVQRKLHDSEIEGTYKKIRTAMLNSVAAHEVQHRLDYGAKRLRKLPKVIEDYTGPLYNDDGEVRTGPRGVLAEYSAYLSELARSPELVRTNLLWVSRTVLNKNFWGSKESYAAVAMLEHLSPEPIAVFGTTDREAVSRGLLTLLEEPPEALSRRASKLWKETMGMPLAAITLVPRPQD